MTAPAPPTPMVTQSFPRFRFGTTPSVIDLLEPLGFFLPTKSGLRAENVVQSGKKEYLYGRLEEQVRIDLVFQRALDQYQRVRWFLEDWGFQGNQFELWVDRFTGSCWLFEETLRDQNGLALTLQGGGSVRYLDSPGGRGWSPTVGQYLSVPLAQSSAATKTGYDDPLDYREGTLLVDFTPIFSGDDGVSHVIVSTPTGSNRLLLYKTASNALAFVIYDDTGAFKEVTGAVSWPGGFRVVIVATWATDGALRLWLGLATGVSIGGATGTIGDATGTYASYAGPLIFTELTSVSGAGSGRVAALPATLYLGSNGGGDPAYGVYDTVAFYKRAWPPPGAHSVIPWYRPMWRNYFPYGELVQAVFEPQRYLTPATNAWRQSLTVRNGLA